MGKVWRFTDVGTSTARLCSSLCIGPGTHLTPSACQSPGMHVRHRVPDTGVAQGARPHTNKDLHTHREGNAPTHYLFHPLGTQCSRSGTTLS